MLRHKAVSTIFGVAALAMLSATSASLAQDVTLTLLFNNDPATVKMIDQLIADFEAKNPGITIETELRPAGGEGDNIVKTRLATGDMTDIFLHNSGSLFQAINPQQNLVPLTNEPMAANLLDSFKVTVTAGGDFYGAPIGTAQSGAVLYNKKLYAELGLSVPRSWSEFMANNEKVKAAGKTAVIQTFKDTWSSQLFVLADFFNVSAAEPDFAARYTANQAKYATDAAARKGFERQEEVFKAGYLNADFASASFADGLRMLATAEGAHYPMLTGALPTIASDYPDLVNDIGVFPLPGDSADSNGLTIWLPNALYIPKTSQHIDEAKKFLAFLSSVDGCDSQTKAVGAAGPYVVKGCTLPETVLPAVAEMVQYFDDPARNSPALEFLSPIKGPSLEQITVEVGSGIRSAADGAALYDEDVKKQAQQLGLPGW
ncbi:MAG: extracellular solute-binding protein [Devosia sp.]|uniref:ABC transporter substrate-binding protein n=1 Tax=Devosia sp. TaxID=1871048 RepID=UPI001A42EF0E|nr:extracellular solute-binding protein [Devosia sp.]MBL8599557.1 extracellular solute-binding protein [Devosia sp.]